MGATLVLALAVLLDAGAQAPGAPHDSAAGAAQVEPSGTKQPTSRRQGGSGTILSLESDLRVQTGCALRVVQAPKVDGSMARTADKTVDPRMAVASPCRPH